MPRTVSREVYTKAFRVFICYYFLFILGLIAVVPAGLPFYGRFQIIKLT